MIEAKMKWGGKLKFEGTSQYGHPIVTDGGKKSGGDEAGYMPTELLLYSIAGCTGIDVVRILEKQRQNLESLEIVVRAYQNESYPKPFNRFEVKFIAKGDGLDPKKLAKAIELSEQKYCVASQTMQEIAEVVTSFEIV